MSLASSSSVGMTRLAVTVLATCIVAFAAEPAPAEPAPVTRKETPPGEALDAARRDFQTLKATRDPAQQQKAALPKLGMPSMSTGVVEPQPIGPLRPEPATPPGGKSPNWLVDAMNKSEREAAGRHGDRRPDRGLEDFRGDPAMLRARERAPAGREDSRLPSVGGKSQGVGVDDARNPFSRYLGDWMTPRDYAVLKPALDVPMDSRTGAEGRSPPPLPMSPLPVGITTPDASRGLPAAKLAAAPRENPYLQAPPPVASAAVTPPRTTGNAASPAASFTPGVPVARPAATVAPAAPQPATRSQIPDFLKPARDEKYFKQLKRF